MAGTIVVGYDGSAGADRAVEWALGLAQRRVQELRLVRAFDVAAYNTCLEGGWSSATLGELRQVARDELARAEASVRARDPKVKVSSSFREDSAERMLVEESRHADTVVLGSHVHSTFHTMLASPTAMYVAAHASCTVVVLPEEMRHDAQGVVVGVDGSDVSAGAIEYAFRFADETHQPLLAIQAWTDRADAVTHAAARRPVGVGAPLVASPQQSIAERDQRLAAALAGYEEKYPSVEVERLLVHDLPAPALVRHADDAALLVVGCRGRASVAGILLGSVSRAVLHLARCPVAVVRASA